MSRQLTDGRPVPADNSHTEINPRSGQQRAYVVLSPDERAKGYVKPLRDSYKHAVCGATTRMSADIASTYARDPWFYSSTFCIRCRTHLPLDQFTWEPDGESMAPKDWPAAEHERIAVLRVEQGGQG